MGVECSRPFCDGMPTRAVADDPPFAAEALEEPDREVCSCTAPHAVSKARQVVAANEERDHEGFERCDVMVT